MLVSVYYTCFTLLKQIKFLQRGIFLPDIVHAKLTLLNSSKPTKHEFFTRPKLRLPDEGWAFRNGSYKAYIYHVCLQSTLIQSHLYKIFHIRPLLN